MKYMLVILALALMLLGACTANKSNQGAVVKDDFGFLRLTGSMANREVLIDGSSVAVDTEDDVNRFGLKAGTHDLLIRSSNRVLLTQKVFITGGQTVDLMVP